MRLFLSKALMGARKDVEMGSFTRMIRMGSKKIGSLIKRRYSPGGYRHIPEAFDEKGLPKHRASGFHLCKEAWVWIGHGGGKAQYLVGGLGFASSGNIGDAYAIFEPTHGSAPKYAGTHKVNPMAMLLTTKLMLDYLGEEELASRLEAAIARVIREGEVRTYDMGGGNTTLEVAGAGKSNPEDLSSSPYQLPDPW
jgi:hypothetical protein